MRFGGLVALEGVPIPPDGGPRRVQFLRRRGANAAALADSSYEKAIEQIQRHAGGLAVTDNIRAPSEGVSETDDWERARLALGFRWGRDLAGEASAREALGHAVDAYRDMRGTEDEEPAHRQMHRIGALAGGLYGCWNEWDESEDLWFWACNLSLAHSPFGLSIGMTGRWICSICREDASSCDHQRGVMCPVEVSRDAEGQCNICLETGCSHMPGQIESTAPSYISVDGLLHEVSLTENPVEPRARVMRVSMDPQPPPQPPGTRLRCRRCLAACDQP